MHARSMRGRSAAEYARKALVIHPGIFGARISLAIRHSQFDWDWWLAEREFRDLATYPRLFVTNAYQPVALFHLGNGAGPSESVALMERALRTDPRNVESRVMMADLLAQAGRLDDSISHYKAIIEAEPADPRPLFGLAEVLRSRRRHSGAIVTLRKAYELTDERREPKALASARTEKTSRRPARHGAVPARGARSAGEGAICVTPRSGTAARESRDPRSSVRRARSGPRGEVSGLVFLKVDRMWDPIRGDARFSSVVRRIGIP